MSTHPSQVTTSKAVRPVRLAYFIQNRDDIRRAAFLNTHLWGGGTNVLVPVPPYADEAEVTAALTTFRPDIVVCTEPINDDRIERVAEQYPAYFLTLSDGALQRHAAGEELLTIRHRPLPHAAQVLQQEGTARQDKPIILISDPADSALAGSLLIGAPCDRYRALLEHYFEVRRTSAPLHASEAFKLAVLTGDNPTPLSITRLHLKQSWSMQLFGNARDPLTAFGSDSERVLILFLDDGASLRVPCSFWNSRRFARPENRHIVGLDDFPNAVSDLAALIAGANNLGEVVLIAETTEQMATEVRSHLVESLAKLNCRLPIAMYYGHASLGIIPGRSYSGVKEVETRSLTAERSIRFSLSTPACLPGMKLLYGFDADVTVDGRKLELPTSGATTLLLQNAQREIVAARRKEDTHTRHFLDRTPDLRAQPAGVTGLAEAGVETVIYLHDEADVVTAILEQAGLRLTITGHNRAASAFIGRIGTVAAACQFYREGGFHLLRALSAHRAVASGTTLHDMRSYLGAIGRLERSVVQRLLDHWLDRLLSKGLVRRGVALKCQTCDLSSWYALDSLRDPLSCSGCDEVLPLPRTSIQISFRVNELVNRLVREGGEALFMTAVALRESDNRSLLHFGGDLYDHSTSQHVGEVDLIAATPAGLIFAECKDWNEIGSEQIAGIERSLQRTIAAASSAGCKEVVLGIRTSSAVEPLLELVLAASPAQDEQVDVALLFNGAIYTGAHSCIEPRKVTFNPPMRFPAPVFVGARAKSISSGSINPLFDAALKSVWLHDLTRQLPRAT